MDITRYLKLGCSQLVKALLAMLCIGCWCAGCESVTSAESEPLSFLFLGHPYDWNQGNRLDPRLERIDFSCFDQVWLGGDVCSRTTEDPLTMEYLDSVLDFSNNHVQWTWGNHDIKYGYPDRITAKTKQASFYTTQVGNGITLLVLNTNLFWMYRSKPVQEDCEQKEAQLQLINSVLDTIQASSHLVILHHHALLKDHKPEGLQEAFNTNPLSVAMTCDSVDQFTASIYPKLVTVQKRGVQVLLVGGDIGMRAKKLKYQTSEGIWLLGAGLNNSLKRENAPEYVKTFDPDEILIFTYVPGKQVLNWDFYPLNEWLDSDAMERNCAR